MGVPMGPAPAGGPSPGLSGHALLRLLHVAFLATILECFFGGSGGRVGAAQWVDKAP